MSRVRPRPSKPIIGLAGGIGAGKSAVARILESLGAAVIDSDQLSHEQYRDPEVIATLRAWWGGSVCATGGEVDRRALAEIVFENPSELARLESLLYPRVARRREELIAEYETDRSVPAIVLDSPKLFEVGLNELCDSVIYVDADWSVRARRMGSARGWTEEELRRRENLLNPLDSKKAIADHVVVNHSSIAALRPEIERIYASVLAVFTE